LAKDPEPLYLDFNKSIHIDFGDTIYPNMVPSGIHIGPLESSTLIVPIDPRSNAGVPAFIEPQIPRIVELCNPMMFDSVPFTQVDRVPANKATLYLPEKKS